MHSGPDKKLPLMSKEEFRKATAYVGPHASVHRRSVHLRKIDDALDALHHSGKSKGLFKFFRRDQKQNQKTDLEKLRDLNTLINTAIIEVDLRKLKKNEDQPGDGLMQLQSQVKNLMNTKSSEFLASRKAGIV